MPTRCDEIILPMLESEGLSILSEINRRRGYIVLSSGHSYQIGYIMPGLAFVDRYEGRPLEDTERQVDQPLRIVAQTDRADFDEQIALSMQLSPKAVKPTLPVGPFFYRVVTD